MGASTAAAAATVPPGLADELVANVDAPSAFGFTPDGRILVATLPGVVRVIKDGAVLARPALDLSAVVCTERERGLLGLAVDPQFATNRFVYLYYTFAKQGTCEIHNPTNPVNRVSRFKLGLNNRIDPASERVLIDDMPSYNANHNAGALEFGLDETLFVTVGDGGCDYAGDSGCAKLNDASRDQNILLGKVLRITRAGRIPADNPYQGAGTVRCALSGGRTTSGNRCRETYASGFRNPFRLAVDPATGMLFVNDVGQAVWEEVDDVVAGGDYGWNIREGFCATGSTTDCGPPPAGLTNPIHAYPHADGCNAITAGAFVPPGAWGGGGVYDGDYLFSDFGCPTIFRLHRSDATWTTSTFATALPSKAVDFVFGPSADGPALYYATLSPTGSIRRIVLSG